MYVEYYICGNQTDYYIHNSVHICMGSMRMYVYYCTYILITCSRVIIIISYWWYSNCLCIINMQYVCGVHNMINYTTVYHQPWLCYDGIYHIHTYTLHIGDGWMDGWMMNGCRVNVGKYVHTCVSSRQAGRQAGRQGSSQRPLVRC